jgi:transposase
MPTKRSTAELELLAAEAERLVRAGESRADVAHTLGVPLSTMTDWARKGGWLRRDLDAEREPEQARLVAERIAQLRAGEEERRLAVQRRNLSLAAIIAAAATAATDVFANPAGEVVFADPPDWPREPAP